METTKFDKLKSLLDNGDGVYLTFHLGRYLHKHHDIIAIEDFVNYCDKQIPNKLAIRCLSMIDLCIGNEKSKYITPYMITRLNTEVFEYNTKKLEDLSQEFGDTLHPEAIYAWLALYEQRCAYYCVAKMAQRVFFIKSKN